MHLRAETLYKKILVAILAVFLSTLSYADELIIEPDMGRQPILSALSDAKTSIDLVLYGFTDNAFTDALIRAKNNGKNIRILLEPSPYKNANENSAAIQQLQDANILPHFSDPQFKLTHQKTFILDQQKAIIMTFNLTHSTFKKERNFAVMITDPKTISEIQAVFTADWAHKNITVHQPNLVWSPNNSREKITDFIRGAHTNIKIYAQDISDYKIIGELAKAARDGVTVEIIMSDLDRKPYRKKLDYLKKAGVVIQNNTHYQIHAKVIIVDQERALLGSTNLTKPSIDNNRELSIITEDPHVITPLLNTFQQDWQGAPARAIHRSREIHTSQLSRVLLRELRHLSRQLNY